MASDLRTLVRTSPVSGPSGFDGRLFKNQQQMALLAVLFAIVCTPVPPRERPKKIAIHEGYHKHVEFYGIQPSQQTFCLFGACVAGGGALSVCMGEAPCTSYVCTSGLFFPSELCLRVRSLLDNGNEYNSIMAGCRRTVTRSTIAQYAQKTYPV